MGRREWIVITLCVAALVGIIIVIAMNRPEPVTNRPASDPDDELFRRMTGDPNKEVEDQTLTVVTRLGGEIVRQQGHPNFQPVIEVSFRDRPVTDADLQELAGLINLRKFDLSGTKVTDAGLRSLIVFRYLDALNLARTPVTGAGLAELTPLTLLKHVVLAGSKVNDTGLTGLSGVPKVTDLDLSDSAVTNWGIDRLKGLPVLSNLNLAHSKVSGSAANQLRELGLAKLDLTGIALTTDQYFQLVGAKPRKDTGAPPPGGPIPVAPQPTLLTLVGVRRPVVTDDLLKTLADRGELKQLVLEAVRVFDVDRGDDPDDPKDNEAVYSVLDLKGSPITDAGLRHLKDFDDFASLNLTGTKITDAALAGLNCQHLRSLYLDETAVTSEAVKSLSKFNNLRVVGLRRTKVADAGLKHLANVKSLRRLDLEGTPVTDAGLADLKALDKLAVLRLTDTGVTDAGLKHLHALKSLRSLDLNNTKVTDAGVAELKAQLPNCAIKH